MLSFRVKTLDRRRLAEMLNFSQAHGVEFTHPSSQVRGSIMVPVMAIGPEEMEAVASATSTKPFVDKQAVELDELRAELARTETRLFTGLPRAVEILLAERKLAGNKTGE